MAEDLDTSQRVDELIEGWLEDGGKETVYYRCEHCGKDGSKTLDRSIDLDKLIRLRKELREERAKGGGGGDVSRDAEKILAAVRDMTDEELAVELARERALGDASADA